MVLRLKWLSVKAITNSAMLRIIAILSHGRSGRSHNIPPSSSRSIAGTPCHRRSNRSTLFPLDPHPALVHPFMEQTFDILNQISAVQSQSKGVAQALFQLTDRSRPVDETAVKEIRQDFTDWLNQLQQFCRKIEVGVSQDVFSTVVNNTGGGKYRACAKFLHEFKRS